MLDLDLSPHPVKYKIMMVREDWLKLVKMGPDQGFHDYRKCLIRKLLLPNKKLSSFYLNTSKEWGTHYFLRW